MSTLSQIYFNKNIDDVDFTDIQSLIKEKVKEDDTIDYKMKEASYNDIAKVMSSFLNTKGGLIVYGVKENNEIPIDISGCDKTEIQLQRSLFKRVTPWHNNIKIKKIVNLDDPDKYVILIEVPKSKIPPHMANNRYYYRNYEESTPMTHYQIKRIFNESWMIKTELIDKVVGPFINDISMIIRKMSYEYDHPLNEYEKIIKNYRYLMLQLSNIQLVDDIDTFYEMIKKRKVSLSKLYIEGRNITFLKAKDYFFQYKRTDINSIDDIILVKAITETIYLQKGVQQPHYEKALLYGESLIKNIKRINSITDVVEINYVLLLESGPEVIPEGQFDAFWDLCIEESKRNPVFQHIWKSSDDILEWSYTLIIELQALI